MRYGRDPSAGLCDYCGKPFNLYTHEGCEEGYGSEPHTGEPELLTASAGHDSIDPWKKLLEGPGAERQT